MKKNLILIVGHNSALAKNFIERHPDDDMVIILTPSGLQALKDNEIDIVSFYIDVDDKERYIRQILRGDNINEIARRSNTDEEDFKGIESKVSYVIENNTNNIWDCVISTLSKISEKR